MKKTILLLLGLMACTDVPSMKLTPEECVATFKRYDYEIDRAIINPFAYNPKPWNSNEIERQETFLRTGGCLTTGAQLRAINGADWSSYRLASGGTPIDPVTLHLATVTSFQDGNAFVALLQSLGYRVETTSGTDLGRRVYLRNIPSREAMETALAMSKAMNLPATYPGPVLGLTY